MVIAPLTLATPRQYGKLCKRFDDMGFRIELRQKGIDRFSVIYGLQVDENLTYVVACAKLGQAILHALSCEGHVDNRERRA